jgi:CHAT domain-containing protein/tetratricopeptide (TPR) repeat protein
MLRLNFPTQAIIAFILLVFLSGVSSVQGQNINTSLEPGKTIDREIKNGEVQVYEFTLAANEHARVELKSGKARLNLSVLSEKNELIATISDSDSPDLKRLDIVAEKPTQFFIRITPERSQTSAAKYHLTFAEKNTAISADRERYALHVLDWEVVSLYRQQEKSALQKAADKGRAAAARWQVLGEPERAGRMLDRAGRCLFLLSRHQESRAAYEQAIGAFHQAGAKLAEATSLNNLASQSYNSGDYKLMGTSAMRALMIWQSAHDVEGLRLIRFQQAYAYSLFGESQKAEDMCRSLLTEVGTAQRIDEWDRVYREDVLTVMGIALVSHGEARQSLTYLEAAIALTRQTHNRIQELVLLQQLSLAWQKLGDQPKALNYLRQSLAGSKRLGLHEGETDSYYKLGQLYISLGRRNDARKAFSEAVNAASQSGKRYLLLALMGQARFLHDQGEQEAALSNTEQALTVLEGLVTQIPLDSIRSSFHAQEREAWALRTDLLVHLHERNPKAGYDAKALQVSESARSRSLLQLLGEKHLLPSEVVDKTLTVRANELRHQIAATTSEKVRLLKNPAASARLAEIENERNLLTQELDRVAATLRTQNPHSAALTMPDPLSLREIQQQVLDRNTLLLEYELGVERSFLFVVTPDAFHTFILPSRTIIEPIAKQVYEALSRSQQPKIFTSVTEKQSWLQRNEIEYQQAAAKLSAMILKPAAALLGDKRLLVVKDGALQYVPFAALPECGVGIADCGLTASASSPKNTSSRVVPQSPIRNPHSSLPLILNHEIVSLPSASTLAVLRREVEGYISAPKTLVVIADPVFDIHDERLDSATFHSPSRTLIGVGTLPESFRTVGEMVDGGNMFFPRLPASRNEAEAVLALVPTDQRESVLDFDANYKAVTQGNLSQYRFVHFATHGLLDEIHPELSGLLLSQVNRQGDKVDGFFTTLDAFNLKLNADLVVLSGCRTALGKEVKGEGLMGLTRGFMYAGARRVMASLWQVNDDATAELMKRFYQETLGEKKMLPAAALRAAQREMLKDPRWHSPYYWAAFTLQGEW